MFLDFRKLFNTPRRQSAFTAIVALSISITGLFNRHTLFSGVSHPAKPAYGRSLSTAVPSGQVNGNNSTIVVKRSLEEDERAWVKSRFGDTLDPATITIEIDNALNVKDKNGNIVLGQTREGSPGIIFLNPTIVPGLKKYSDPANKDLYDEAVRAHEIFHYWQEKFPDHWAKVVSEKTNSNTYDFQLTENTKLLELSKERQASAFQNFEIRLNNLANVMTCVQAFRLKALLKQELSMDVSLPCEGFAPLGKQTEKHIDMISNEFAGFANKNNFLVYLMRTKPTAERAVFVHQVWSGEKSGFALTPETLTKMRHYVQREDVKPFLYQKLTNEETFNLNFGNASERKPWPFS